MEKYIILSNEFYSRKKLTQEEIEKNDFEEFDDTTIFKTDNKEEAENTIKELIKYKYNSYDCYHKNYSYKRFELVKEVVVDDDPDYSEYESLGIFYPNYEDEENDEEEEDDE